MNKDGGYKQNILIGKPATSSKRGDRETSFTVEIRVSVQNAEVAENKNIGYVNMP